MGRRSEPISDFVEACAEEPRRAEAGWAPFWRYLEIGTYGKQLRHLGTLFPPDQIHLIRYKSLVDEPRQTLDGICRFLGVSEGLLDEAPPMNLGGYVPPTLYTRTLQTMFRKGRSLGRHFPPQVWRKASLPLQWLIQRTPQHRPELSEEHRGNWSGTSPTTSAIVEEITGWDLGQWLTYRQGGTYSVRKSWAPSRRLVS